MKPIITVAGDRATLEADTDFLRLLLVEARRSGQSQLGAYGVTTAWRSFWTGKIAEIDVVLAHLPRDPERMSKTANLPAKAVSAATDDTGSIAYIVADELDVTHSLVDIFEDDDEIDLLA